MTITTPASLASVDLYCASNCPTSVEIAPRVMNTMLKPRMNPIELSITLRVIEILETAVPELPRLKSVTRIRGPRATRKATGMKLALQKRQRSEGEESTYSRHLRLSYSFRTHLFRTHCLHGRSHNSA